MTSAIRAQRDREAGFTLIELLVVVIIIGILAAIAIPAFLNQRERAWQAQLTSAVRNAALDVEAEATAGGGIYPAEAVGEPIVDGFEDSTTHDYVTNAGGTDFCIIGTHGSITDFHFVEYVASLGGLQPYEETAALVAAGDTACGLDV